MAGDYAEPELDQLDDAVSLLLEGVPVDVVLALYPSWRVEIATAALLLCYRDQLRRVRRVGLASAGLGFDQDAEH